MNSSSKKVIAEENKKQMSFSTELTERMDDCFNSISKKFEKDISSLNAYIDSTFELIRQYYTALMCDGHQEIELLAYDSIFSNLEYLSIAVFLNSRGQFAQTRALFRNVYETLVIVKYMMITENDEFTEKYKNDREIKLKADIYKNVSMNNNDKRILETFYQHLCSFAHFSFYSNSLTGSDDDRMNEVNANFELCRILLCLNYHVLNSYCFLGKYKAKIDRWVIPLENDISTKEKRQICHNINKSTRKDLTAAGKNIVLAFSKKWKLREI